MTLKKTTDVGQEQASNPNLFPISAQCCVCNHPVMIDRESTQVLSLPASEVYAQLIPVLYPDWGNYPFCGACADPARLLSARRQKIHLGVLNRARSLSIVEHQAPHEVEDLFRRFDREEREHRAQHALLPPEVARTMGYDLFGGEVIRLDWSGRVEVEEYVHEAVRNYDGCRSARVMRPQRAWVAVLARSAEA